MDLNIRTNIITLPITMDSGLVLNIQVPQPVVLQMGNIAFAEWGHITGSIENQADLKEQLDELRILAYAGL